jgi:hypothetical protein
MQRRRPPMRDHDVVLSRPAASIDAWTNIPRSLPCLLNDVTYGFYNILRARHLQAVSLAIARAVRMVR